MQKIQYERGGNLIWSYQNTIDAYSKKVTGFTKVDQTGWGLGRCQLNRLSFVYASAHAYRQSTADEAGGRARQRRAAEPDALDRQAARAQRPHPARRLDPRLRGDPGAPRRPRAADPRPRRRADQLARCATSSASTARCSPSTSTGSATCSAARSARSLATHEPVSSVISDRGLNSLALVLCSAVIAIPLSLAARHVRRRPPRSPVRPRLADSCCSCSPRCPSS